MARGILRKLGFASMSAANPFSLHLWRERPQGGREVKEGFGVGMIEGVVTVDDSDNDGQQK